MEATATITGALRESKVTMAMEAMEVTIRERLILAMVMEATATITGALRESRDTMAMEAMEDTIREMLSQDMEDMGLLMSMSIRLTMDTSILNPTAMVTTFMEVMVMERDLLRLNLAMVMVVIALCTGALRV